MANTNALEDIKCPHCGYEDEFEIAAEAIFTVTDEGTSEFRDVAWDSPNWIRCNKCTEHGTVGDFLTKCLNCSCRCPIDSVCDGCDEKLCLSCIVEHNSEIDIPCHDPACSHDDA